MENEIIISQKHKEIISEIIANELSKSLFDIMEMTTKERIKFISEIIMKAERKLHLLNGKYSASDKANGYYKRKLNSSLGEIELNVPRDRDGDFRSKLLPEKYKRFEDSYVNLLSACLNNFYSPNSIKNILKDLNLSYSSEEYEKLSELIYEEFKIFQNRQLPHSCIGIFIDGFSTEIYDEEKNKVVKAVIYLVLGIDFEGKKDLYAVEFLKGNENKEGWLQIFNKLVSRGLKKPLIVVSDDFNGITEAVKTIFPKSLHQLCWIHFVRNLKKNVSKNEFKNLKEKLYHLKFSNEFENAKEKFIELFSAYKSKYPYFVENVIKKSEYYLCFLKLPENVRKNFYTTNISESFNSIIRKIEINSGGYFRSKKGFELSCFIRRNQLKRGKWSKPVPAIAGNLYELRQLYVQIFGEEPRD